jgi:hypothetical protein
MLAPLALAGCSDSTGTAASGQVQIRFGVAQGARASLAAASGPRFATGTPLVVTGSNGTLSITDIKLVVSRFQLRGADGSSCGATAASGVSADRGSSGGGSDDGANHERGEGECEFQAGPQFVTLPLDGSQLTVTTGAVPAGTFTSVRFRVKNLDFDDDDDHDDDDNSAAQQALLAQIRAQIADWPAKASMLVTGTFTPTGGAPRTFRAFLRAEVRLTLPINPPLTVAEGSNTAQVAVLLDPASFFRTGTTVVDLSQFTGGVVDFRDGAEHGFESEGHHGSGHN